MRNNQFEMRNCKIPPQSLPTEIRRRKDARVAERRVDQWSLRMKHFIHYFNFYSHQIYVGVGTFIYFLHFILKF